MPSQSIWLSDVQSRYNALKRVIKTDTVVIGGGIAGLTTAYYLAKAGVPVVVLEARTIGRGTTGHTTAHVTSQHDLTYARYIRRFGMLAASKVAQANEGAIRAIRAICDEEQIACDLTNTTSYLFSNEKKGITQLYRECEAAVSLGINAIMADAQTCPLPCGAALAFYGQAMFHPLRYLEGLAAAVVKYGGKIFEHTRALHISGGNVGTDGGAVLAHNIVIATHNPVINAPGYYFAKMYQHRSYAVALTGTPPLSGMWNCIDKNGHTYRCYEDTVIVCGEDHQCGTQRHINHYDALIAHALGIFPKARVAAQWSAQDGITLDNLPYIGNYARDSKSLYVATGFGKWGMTQGTIAGQVISDAILVHHNPYADVFSPQRPLTPAAVLGFLYVNLSTLAHFVGGLFRLGNPTCPHLRCKLAWNKDERTWDCPCHGSRFEEDGDVIDSPAIHGITRK